MDDEGKLELKDYNEELKYKFDYENYDIIKVQRYIKNENGSFDLETLYERKEILTEEEKEYLSGVIRPFRERVLYIIKENYVEGDIIAICLNHEQVPLPFFKEGTMYKGMKTYKEYTLEELGL